MKRCKARKCDALSYDMLMLCFEGVVIIVIEFLAYAYVVIELFNTILLIMVMLDGKACQFYCIVNVCTNEQQHMLHMVELIDWLLWLQSSLVCLVWLLFFGARYARYARTIDNITKEKQSVMAQLVYTQLCEEVHWIMLVLKHRLYKCNFICWFFIIIRYCYVVETVVMQGNDMMQGKDKGKCKKNVVMLWCCDAIVVDVLLMYVEKAMIPILTNLIITCGWK